jgi:hypothetical protein
MNDLYFFLGILLASTVILVITLIVKWDAIKESKLIAIGAYSISIIISVATLYISTTQFASFSYGFTLMISPIIPLLILETWEKRRFSNLFSGKEKVISRSIQVLATKLEESRRYTSMERALLYEVIDTLVKRLEEVRFEKIPSYVLTEIKEEITPLECALLKIQKSLS